MELRGLKANPLLERVLDVFDENKDGEIQFTEFITALSIFNQRGNDEAKLRCKYRPLLLTKDKKECLSYNILLLPVILDTVAFQIYDIDNDGYISNGELFIVLKKMVGKNLSDEQVSRRRHSISDKRR
jgi:serine/threonine-protein phosphatase 2B regulatory subunit